MLADRRPTSPHLTIYNPQISTVLSITHRMTGVWLSVGAAVLVAWLYVVAYDPASYSKWYECMSSWVGQIALLSWTFAFYFHLCSGIRHLFWDIGKGYAVPTMNLTGWLVIFFSAAFTAVTWGFVQSVAGYA